MAKADVRTIHRWVARARTHFVPDFTLRISSDLRYQDVQVHNEATPLIAREELIGKRLMDVLPAPLVCQFVAAAQRAICTEEPAEIRYPLILDGRMVMSRARIRADREARIFIAEILRFASVAVLAS